MPFEFPLHRLEEFAPLSPCELSAVTKLGSKPYVMARGSGVRFEGDPVTGFFLLLEGWVLASMILPSGNCQVLKVHLPGDVLGAPSMSSDLALETLTTITGAVVSVVSLTSFGRLIEDHPRIAMRFLLSAQRERIALMDQLTSMGRTSAKARLAALLLDLADRLAPLQLVRDDAFNLLLTQRQISDMLGLSVVHVNRMLRQLEQKGLIARTGRRLSILARAALAELAARPLRPVRKQLDWMPPER